MEFDNRTKDYPCVDCNRSNQDPSSWVPATRIVPLEGELFAMCEACYQVSQVQSKTSLYHEWVGRSNTKKRVWLPEPRMTYVSPETPVSSCICAKCQTDGKVVQATETFHEEIPVCAPCNKYLTETETFLTYYERGWLDQLIVFIRELLVKQLAPAEVHVYK